MRSDGITDLHARYVIETEDRNLIYVENTGIRYGPPELMEKLRRGEPVDPALIYFRSSPRFETAAPAIRMADAEPVHLFRRTLPGSRRAALFPGPLKLFSEQTLGLLFHAVHQSLRLLSLFLRSFNVRRRLRFSRFFAGCLACGANRVPHHDEVFPHP